MTCTDPDDTPPTTFLADGSAMPPGCTPIEDASMCWLVARVTCRVCSHVERAVVHLDADLDRLVCVRCGVHLAAVTLVMTPDSEGEFEARTPGLVMVASD